MPKNNAWYPIRVTYGRVLLLQKQLEQRKVKCFVPLIKKIKMVKDKPVTQLVPAISNYLFVFTDRDIIHPLKLEFESIIPFRFLLDPITKMPATVPTNEMEHFIALSGTQDDQLIYLKPNEFNYKKGDLVKIIDGPFKGVEGRFVRIKGDRRVLVSIEGVMAVATAFMHPSLIVPVT